MEKKQHIFNAICGLTITTCIIICCLLVISDVDECLGKHYCRNADCLNNNGSYSCECFEGYELFRSTDMDGYTIPVSEDGYRAGDVYYINHTCVSKYSLYVH